MAGRLKDEILHDHNYDGIDRRGFLKCMAWAVTGALCVMSGAGIRAAHRRHQSPLTDEFDTVDQILKSAKPKDVFYVPGENVKHLKHSTPIVVFAHIPLWSVYPKWGWGTEDSAQALANLKKFGSVTVLNGHIHQTMQKVEGNVTFHTARSTAFPQPQPGKADSPGPMKVPTEQLKSVLGITDVNYVQGQHALAVVDSTFA